MSDAELTLLICVDPLDFVFSEVWLDVPVNQIGEVSFNGHSSWSYAQRPLFIEFVLVREISYMYYLNTRALELNIDIWAFDFVIVHSYLMNVQLYFSSELV